jgi:signal transduction histidine kinase
VSDHIPRPFGEARRLAALHSYGILDTEPEAVFDDITRIASYICQTPMALISLVEDKRQWFKAEVGLGARETPIGSSICAHAIRQPALLEVPDTTRDARFANNPLVTGEPHLRFYAGAVMRSAEGLPLGTVCVLDTKPRQLTEAQREMLLLLARQAMAQLDLRRALQGAARIEHQRSLMMRAAGHDLKQPLQVITMSVDSVQRQLTDAKQREKLGLALDASQRLAADLDRMAQASSIADADIVSRARPIALRDILAAAVEAWRPQADEKGLQLRLVACSAQVVSEPGMLGTIIGNLIGNAIKYTERGGVVVGCRVRSDIVSIEIADTGIGIPQEHIADIFETFRQLNPNADGLGLGLSIVKSGAELLGHKVLIESRVGSGSRFRIEVPRAK